MNVRAGDSGLYNDQLARELMKMVLLSVDWLEWKAHPLDEILNMSYATLLKVNF